MSEHGDGRYELIHFTDFVREFPLEPEEPETAPIHIEAEATG